MIKLSQSKLLMASLLSTSLLTLPATAFAQDAGADTDVEEISVTGSRIVRKSDFIDGAQVISMDDLYIENLGTMIAADVLRASPLNSFGSFSERSGSSAQSNATINLRGMGSARSLVLLNGTRLPGSPNLGAASMNLNMIPMAALDRIDVLADGASAVYGSDAVAGVVNMVLKENFEGFEANVRHAIRDNDDGTEQGISFLVGASNDKGNVTAAVEWNKRDAIYDIDRDYTSPYATDTDGSGLIDIYNETDGYSFYGRTWELEDETTGYYSLQAASDCPTTDGWGGVMGASALGDADGTVCAYGYGNVSANKAELDRLNGYISGNYDLNEYIELYGRALFSQVKSFGRFAPPAAAWPNPPADYSHNPFDMDALLADGSITADAALNGYYRWTNIGTRDNEVTDNQTDFMAGARGQINENLSYDVYAQISDYSSKEFGYYYLSYTGLDYVLEEGIDPFSEEGANAMRAVPTQDNFVKQNKVYGHVQQDIDELFGLNDISILFGAEAFSTDYQNKYDAQSEAGLIGGSAGNSSSGGRDVYAVFAEAFVPVTDQVELNIAGRYDSYSDFGEAFSPSASVVYNPLDNLTLRARVGKAFRAPSLSTLYGPTSFSAESAYDPVSDTDRQFDTYYATNPEVDAETSTSISFGGNWGVTDFWDIDLSYFSIDIDDVIVTPTAQSLLYADAAGYDWGNACDNITSSTIAVCRNVSGNVSGIYSTGGNEGVFKTTGLDIQNNFDFETKFGDFGLQTLYSYIISTEANAYFGGAVQDTIGYNLQPQDKGQAVLTYDKGIHHGVLTANYTGKSSEEDDVDEVSGALTTSDVDLDSWLIFDAGYKIDLENYNSTVKFGVNNLTNEDPVFDKDGKYSADQADLYNNTGRTYYVEVGVSF